MKPLQQLLDEAIAEKSLGKLAAVVVRLEQEGGPVLSMHHLIQEAAKEWGQKSAP